mmetsp:Transcript_40575/g.60151  ORF Transcript_40575/g.60151 Transcript_40575/m.60151 type:complete len:154 (-) Transcript_40575:68-529(-)
MKQATFQTGMLGNYSLQPMALGKLFPDADSTRNGKRQLEADHHQREPSKRTNLSSYQRSGGNESSGEPKGLLQWTGPKGRCPFPPIYEKKGPKGAKKICGSFVFEGLTCRHKHKCSFLHVTRLNELSSEAQTTLREWVSKTKGVEFAQHVTLG